MTGLTGMGKMATLARFIRCVALGVFSLSVLKQTRWVHLGCSASAISATSLRLRQDLVQPVTIASVGSVTILWMSHKKIVMNVLEYVYSAMCFE